MKTPMHNLKLNIASDNVTRLSPIPPPHRSHSVNKIKFNCFLSNSLNSFNLELPQQTSIRTLKRRISEQLLNLSPKSTSNSSFSVIYNDKNLTHFNQLKLSDIITSRNSKKIPSLIESEPSLSSIDPLQLRIIPTEMSERSSSSSTSYKLKTMLECIEHIDENAHYFCFECKVSFCALCVDKHSQHDFVDKATYAKTSKDIVDDIIRDMNMTIHEQYEKELCNANSNANSNSNEYKERLNDFIKTILGNVRDDNKQQVNEDEVSLMFKELMDKYNEYIMQFNKEYMATLNMKVDDYKDSLKKFKLICLNNLNKVKSVNNNNSNNNSNAMDIVLSNEMYLINIHNTLKELSQGKKALISYITATNQEINNFLLNKASFIQEIKTSLTSILNTFKSKNINTHSHNCIPSQDYMQTESNYTIYEYDSFSLTSNSLSRTLDINDLSTDQYIMKRRLPHEIVQYNINTKQFAHIKNLNCSKATFKKFLPLSVFINHNNLLYISGGKDKTTNKQTNSFYVYSPITSKLKPLSNMLHPRCSHSMIVINKHLYAVGGYNNNTSEKYSFDINQWCSLPKLNVKERQVSTLFNMNDKYLYCVFGFINGVSCNDVDYAEKLDLNKKDKWRLVPFKVNAGRGIDLKRYNVGIIKIKEGEFVILGGENAQNEESDSVFQMKVVKTGNEKIEISEMKSDKEKKGGGIFKMPIKCSFIDKEFKEVKKGKFAMFEMKKNRFVVYNHVKGVFKVKEF